MLKKHGYYYPVPEDGTKNFNYLAARLASGKNSAVSGFFDKALKQAQQQKCHTVIISAESFYAMTGFFVDPPDKPARQENYFKSEAEFINTLKDICSAFDVRVICYLRPQDDFASSLYNQLIKQVDGTGDACGAFLDRTRQIYNYAGHIRLWEQAFGQKNLDIKNFDRCASHIVADFCSEFLSPAIAEMATKHKHRDNVRLPRDLLEYKRSFNKIGPDKALAHAISKTIRLLIDDKTEPQGYQIFAPYKERRAFFSDFEQDNRRLAQNYKSLGNLPIVSQTDDPSYPGLEKTRAREISKNLRHLLRRPRYGCNFRLRRFVYRISEQSSFFRALLQPLKIIRSRLIHGLRSQ